MSKVFRKSALERLSSPEQLDQLMRVTNPVGWLALGAVILLLLMIVAWGIWGSIPTEAIGEGILIRYGGVSNLVSTATGQVEEIEVAVGDPVNKGQVVARIRQDGLIRQIQDAEAKLAALDQETLDLERFIAEQKRLSASNLAQQRANLERQIATLEKERELLGERATVQRDLLAEGLITQQTLLATEQELNAASDRIAAHRLELNGLELQRLESEQQLDQQLEARRSARRDQELALRELQASLQENANIIAPVSGRVLELTANRGDVVSSGSSVILSMEVSSEELLAVIFVAAGSGKQVQPGMPARIVPSTVRREEHGFMEGTVTRVAGFPSTSQGMLRLLGNQELVNRLMLEGPPIQVDVRLATDPTTPTGFRWSSSRGPDLEITSGTLASSSIILRSDRPFSLLIPGTRKNLGL